MKKPFNKKSGETLDSRQEELEKRVEAIDKFLQTKPPTQDRQLTPGGYSQRQAHDMVQQQFARQRYDIHKEMEEIKIKLERQKLEKKLQAIKENPRPGAVNGIIQPKST